MSAQEWRLVRRPQGWPVATDVALVDVTEPEAGPGEVAVRNLYLSVDPYMRGRMNEAKSYAAPYELDQPMWGGAVGQVTASGSDRFPVGSFVRHGKAWRTHAVCRPSELEAVDADLAPLPAYLGVLGMPGMTAYVGLFDIGEVRPGETVWISAASGAVGALAGQLAKKAGCRVIGSAGGPEKTAFLTETLGFDAAVDHKAGDLLPQLRAAAPEGIDVYFDNVGGDHLQAAIELLNPFGRVIACGMIAGYNEALPGPSNLMQIVGKKLTVRGFIVSDHASRGPVFARHVAGLLAAGEVTYPETVITGIENTFDAFLTLLRGGATLGKIVIKVGDPA